MFEKRLREILEMNGMHCDKKTIDALFIERTSKAGKTRSCLDLKNMFDRGPWKVSVGLGK